MNIEYKDAIGIYSNVFIDGFCEHLINQFEVLNSNGYSRDRKYLENSLRHVKDDKIVFVHCNGAPLKGFEFEEDGQMVVSDPRDMFFKGLQMCFEEYSEKYSILKDNMIYCKNMKIQRTDPGGGYHVWHGEQGNNDTSSRVVVYMLYLNDLAEDDAGETEFLYQKIRLRPVKNTMILWPASYTHAHRGNVVFGNTSKYIATGWFYLA